MRSLRCKMFKHLASSGSELCSFCGLINTFSGKSKRAGFLPCVCVLRNGTAVGEPARQRRHFDNLLYYCQTTTYRNKLKMLLRHCISLFVYYYNQIHSISLLLLILWLGNFIKKKGLVNSLFRRSRGMVPSAGPW